MAIIILHWALHKLLGELFMFQQFIKLLCYGGYKNLRLVIQPLQHPCFHIMSCVLFSNTANPDTIRKKY